MTIVKDMVSYEENRRDDVEMEFFDAYRRWSIENGNWNRTHLAVLIKEGRIRTKPLPISDELAQEAMELLEEIDCSYNGLVMEEEIKVLLNKHKQELEGGG